MIWQHVLFIEHCSQSKEHGIGLGVAKTNQKGVIYKARFQMLDRYHEVRLNKAYQFTGIPESTSNGASCRVFLPTGGIVVALVYSFERFLLIFRDG